MFAFLRHCVSSSSYRSIAQHVSAIGVLALLSGCAQIQSFFPWSELDLSIEVATTDEPGTYRVEGKADLPENTSITVIAVRYLQADDRSSAQLNSEPTYSILAYQPVQIKQGQWQTELNLWQVSPEGRFREIWQIEQSKLGLSLKPEEQVIFLATLTPREELAQLERELAKRSLRFPNSAIYTNSEGFRYAQVQQSLAVALPTRRTSPPALRSEDDNDGWGDRYIIPNEPPNRVELEFPETRKTNAPPKPEEFLY